MEDFGMEFEPNLFATAHGKSSCDGVDGTGNRAIAKLRFKRPFSD